MASEWPRVPVSEVASPVIGGTPDRAVPEYWQGKVPWATAGDVASIGTRYIRATRECISDAGLEHSAAKVLPAGTVVITARGTVGALAQLGVPMAFNQTCYGLIASPRIDRDYLYYALLGSVAEMRGLTHGTVFDTIITRTFDGWMIALPPLAEQRAIAHILGTLDDKIELNRRMNETLEAMAQALFKSWFVDFDPVRAKAEGRAPAGMDAATAALFPDRLVDSELGEIPEGWGVRGLDEVAQFLNGLALQKYPPRDGDCLPVIKIAQLRSGDTEGADRADAGLPAEYVVHDGDVLFSWSGSLQVDIWCGGPGALNQHLFKVTSGKYPKWFYYFWIREHLAEFQEIAAGKATTMGHIQRYHLSEARVLVPPREQLSAMSRAISPILHSLIARRLQSRTLAALRDELLPKLISGEIAVA